MRVGLLILTCFLMISCAGKYQESENQPQDYPVIPKPVSMEKILGKFLVDESTKVYGTDLLKNEGEFLSDVLSAASGKKIIFSEGTSGNIELKLDETIASKEGYELTVEHQKIVVAGNTAKGVFYGIQTLRQLIRQTEGD